jgi:hypothetical protein
MGPGFEVMHPVASPEALLLPSVSSVASVFSVMKNPLPDW